MHGVGLGVYDVVRILLFVLVRLDDGRDGAARDADVDALGHLDDEVVVVLDLLDEAVDPADREDLVADGDRREQVLLLLLASALRADQQHPQQGEHRDDDDQRCHAILLRAAGKPSERGCRVGLQLTALDRRPRARGQSQDEPQIMQGEQTEPEDLLLVQEMPDVRTAESRAGRAFASGLERSRIAGEAGVPEVEPAGCRQRRAGARRAGREHAVEHVDPARDHLEDPLGVAEPHEVARRGDREERRRPGHRVEHRGAALADGEPTEREAVERAGP